MSQLWSLVVVLLSVLVLGRAGGQELGVKLFVVAGGRAVKLFVVAVCFCFGAGGGPGVGCETLRRRRLFLFRGGRGPGVGCETVRRRRLFLFWGGGRARSWV